MSDQKSSRREITLIEPYKQLRFGITFLWLNLLFSTAIIALFGSYLWDIYSALSEYFKMDKAQSEVILMKLAIPAALGIFLIFIFIIMTLVASTRYTHQIYGPLVSIKRFLDELLIGKNPTPIKLRETDQLKDLVSRLNKLSDQLNASKTINHSHDEVLNCIDGLIKGKVVKEILVEDGDPNEELAKKLNKLAKKLGAR